MKQQYLNEFHTHNSLACQRDQKAQAQQPLTIEDVLKASGQEHIGFCRIPDEISSIYREAASPQMRSHLGRRLSS